MKRQLQVFVLTLCKKSKFDTHFCEKSEHYIRWHEISSYHLQLGSLQYAKFASTTSAPQLAKLISGGIIVIIIDIIIITFRIIIIIIIIIIITIIITDWYPANFLIITLACFQPIRLRYFRTLKQHAQLMPGDRSCFEKKVICKKFSKIVLLSSNT